MQQKEVGRITIRIGKGTLSFSVLEKTIEEDGTSTSVIKYEPFVVKSGVSIAANLREAFKTSDLLAIEARRSRVLIDTPVLMVPVEMFEEATMVESYIHAYPDRTQETVLYNVLPDLNAVAVFSINKDLKLVLDDHYQDVQIVAALSPVWRHLHSRSFTGVRSKLYGYFHEHCVDIFAFRQNRFKFCNQFDVRHPQDALYFLLYVWNQLALNNEHDELHLVGDLPEEEWLTQELKKYVKKVLVINPEADFGESPVLKIKGMPYDLMTLYAKGR
jgi:hypothetical protein